jgi:hypothetical protein
MTQARFSAPICLLKDKYILVAGGVVSLASR